MSSGNDDLSVASQANRLRKHACDRCSRTFSKPEHLQRHIRSHTGSKPFACTACEKRFGRQDTLTRHARVHQSSSSKTGPASAAVLQQDARDSITTARHQQLEVSNLIGVDGGSAICPENSGPSHELQQVAMLEVSAPLNSQLEWDETEDILALLTADDTSWLQSLQELHVSPFTEQPSQNAEVIASSHRGEATFTDRGQQAMQQVKQSLRDLSLQVAKEVEGRSISSDFVESCLNMFFTRFLSAIPVVHSPTFVLRDCDHLLLLSMVVLGSVFIVGEESTAKGEALWRLAHAVIATSWEGLLKRQGPNDASAGAQLVITSFHSQTYAMLSGNPKLRSISQTFLGMGFRWARQNGMMMAASKRLIGEPIAPQAPPSYLEKRWKGWVAEEVQRRAILGHYILDGLLTDFSGQPTAVRHTANPVLLPCRDSLFEAKSAVQWLMEMENGEDCNISFRDVFIQIFDPQSTFENLRLTSMSTRVILEGLQSLVYEHHEAGGNTIGTPSKTAIGRALVRLYHSQIQLLPSSQEQVEHAIRWHVICIRLAVETASLAKQICDLNGIPQDLHHCEIQTLGLTDFSSWVDSPDARRALLHAVSLADICPEMNLGRVHEVHLPMAVYTAATIYTSVIVNACQLGQRPTISVPKVEDWYKVWDSKTTVIPSGASTDCNVFAFLSGANINLGEHAVRRNLADELNGLYIVMQQLQPFWGVTSEMSNIVKQWLTIPTMAPRYLNT